MSVKRFAPEISLDKLLKAIIEVSHKSFRWIVEISLLLKLGFFVRILDYALYQIIKSSALELSSILTFYEAGIVVLKADINRIVVILKKKHQEFLLSLPPF